MNQQEVNVKMENKFIKERVVGKEVHEWDLIKTSSIFKPEYKDTNFEIASSYLNAAKSLYKELKMENHPETGFSVLRINSLIIPFLFLCHHSVELGIKVALSDRNITYGNIHNLKKLFEKLDMEVNEEYLDLMNALDLVDDNGMWLRYDKDLKEGKEYLEKPCFANSKSIIESTDKFVRFLIEK